MKNFQLPRAPGSNSRTHSFSVISFKMNRRKKLWAFLFFGIINSAISAQVNRTISDIENTVTWTASVEKQNDSIYKIMKRVFGQKPNYLLKKNQFGDFKAGMLLDSALSLANQYYIIEEDKIRIEGEVFLVYNIILDNSKIFKIEPDCGENCRVYRYWLHSDKFKTAEGLGVGSTIQDILNTYELEDYTYGEGAIFLSVKELNYSFRIEQDFIPEAWWATMNFHKLPKNSRIDMIILSK